MKFESEFGYNEEIYDYVGTTENQMLHALSGITFPDSKYEIIRKNAQCISFEYVYDGEGVIQENGKIYKITAGDFFILHPNCYHHYYASPKKPWKKIFVVIDGDLSFPQMLLEQYSLSKTTIFPALNNSLMFEDIFELFKSCNTNISRKFEILLCNSIISLAHFSKNITSDYTSINKAKRFIDKKIGTKFNIEEVANYANISVSFLCREFKKTFGVTPYNYILNTRVELAKTMLSETNEPIHLICERFNFADIAHFSKAFKKIVGVSPSVFREQQRNNL